MISKLLVTNYLGESLQLELRFPEKSGILVAHVDGLNPPKATINSTELAVQDGARFNSSRVMSRNIVLTLVFLDKNTVEETRRLSYKYFPIKKRVDIRITAGNRVVDTYGYVETNEATIFSSKVSTQISVICPDPYLYSIYTNRAVLSGIASLFEFPFSNESLVSNMIEISEIILTNLVNVPYNGEAETGMQINIKALGPATGIMVFNENTGEIFEIDTSIFDSFVPSGIIAGDEIIISTVIGNKYITFLRDGIYYNILNAVSGDSEWLQLSNGDNLIGFSAVTGAENLQISIDYKTLYQGV